MVSEAESSSSESLSEIKKKLEELDLTDEEIKSILEGINFVSFEQIETLFK